MICEIIFPVNIDKSFYYEVGSDLIDKIKPGIRVYSSFAHRKKVVGYVISLRESLDPDSNLITLKKIDGIIDEKPIFIVEKFIELSGFIARRWGSNPGMVLRNFLRYLPLKLEIKDEIKNTQKMDSERKVIIPYHLNIVIEEIKNAITRDKKVIVFFPNIFSLEFFSRKFEREKIEFLKYSSLESISFKKKVFNKFLSGQINVLFTTKLGVFFPFPLNSYFIVIDPLNSMYRQFEQHPYYSTIEVVEKISTLFHFPVTYYSSSNSPVFIKKKEEGWVIKDESVNFKIDYEIKDIKKENFADISFLSGVKNIMDNGKKILVLSYSRYAAGVVYCKKCGWIRRCDRCKSTMKVELVDGKKKYICKYCNFKADYSNICPICGEVMLEKGYGSQKLYEIFVSNFPDKRIIEIDGRILYLRSKLNDVLEKIIENDYDILIATDVIVSGIVDLKFDYSYFLVYESHNDFDYGYRERFIDKFSLVKSMINPVGKIYFYSFNPESYIFSSLDLNSYLFDENEMRKSFYYPPYAYLYKIEIFSKEKKDLKDKINNFINILEDEDTRKRLSIIDFYPRLKIRKPRNENYYQYTSWIKLKTYEDFMLFLKEYTQQNKLKFDVFEY